MMLKPIGAFGLVVLLVAAACLGCTPKEPVTGETGPVARATAPAGDASGKPTEEPAEEPEPTETASTDGWAWDPETPIDPATIPDAPAVGDMEGEEFIVQHALIEKDTDDETGAVTCDIRFIDTKPGPGEETWGSSDRMMEVTVSEAGAGTVVEVPFGSDDWNLDTAWFWYKKSPSDNTNPNKSASLYIEFTEWDETPSTENRQIAGTAKGRIGVGSQMHGGAACWLAGTFEAVIKTE